MNRVYEMFSKALEIIPSIANNHSLLAFTVLICLGAICTMVWRYSRVPNNVIAIIVAIFVAVLAFAFATIEEEKNIYRPRVTVEGIRGTPIEDAKVWSSVGGEPKKVRGGWQFDIPEESIPRDRRVTFHAKRKSAHARGQKEVQLRDHEMPVTIRLKSDESARVSGLVVDTSQNAIAKARVSVSSHERQVVLTDDIGSFTLPTHKADGENVRLRATKEGYESAHLWYKAGSTSARIVLFPEDG